MLTADPPFLGRHNPFATRFTRPGSLLPLDARGMPLDVGALSHRARTLGLSAIEGVHGAGKSTLLAALARHLADGGLLAGTMRVRSRLDGVLVAWAVLRAPRGTILAIDGWEALGSIQPTCIRWLSRSRRVGLVVNAHGPTGMPTLFHCTTNTAILARIVANLPDHGGVITATDVADAYAAHGGNLREALYDLYDRFERRLRGR